MEPIPGLKNSSEAERHKKIVLDEFRAVLRHQNADNAKAFYETEHLSKTDIFPVLVENFIFYLHEGSSYFTEKFLETATQFVDIEELVSDERVQRVVSDALEQCIIRSAGDSSEYAEKLVNMFKLEGFDLEKKAQETILASFDLESVSEKQISGIIGTFKVSKEFLGSEAVQQKAEDAIIRKLSAPSGHEYALEIKRVFGLSSEILWTRPEFVTRISKKIQFFLAMRSYQVVFQLLETFNAPPGIFKDPELQESAARAIAVSVVERKEVLQALKLQKLSSPSEELIVNSVISVFQKHGTEYTIPYGLETLRQVNFLSEEGYTSLASKVLDICPTYISTTGFLFEQILKYISPLLPRSVTEWPEEIFEKAIHILTLLAEKDAQQMLSTIYSAITLFQLTPKRLREHAGWQAVVERPLRAYLDRYPYQSTVKLLKESVLGVSSKLLLTSDAVEDLLVNHLISYVKQTPAENKSLLFSKEIKKLEEVTFLSGLQEHPSVLDAYKQYTLEELRSARKLAIFKDMKDDEGFALLLKNDPDVQQAAAALISKTLLVEDLAPDGYLEQLPTLIDAETFATLVHTEAVRRGIIGRAKFLITHHNLGRARAMKDAYDFPELLDLDEIQEAGMHAYIGLLQNFGHNITPDDGPELRPEFVRRPEFQEALRNYFVNYTMSGGGHHLRAIREKFSFPEDDFIEALRENASEKLAKGHMALFFKAIAFLPENSDIFKDERAIAAAHTGFFEGMVNGSSEVAIIPQKFGFSTEEAFSMARKALEEVLRSKPYSPEHILDQFKTLYKLTQEDMFEIGNRVFKDNLERGYIDSAVALLEKTIVSPEINAAWKEYIPEYFGPLLVLYDIKTLDELAAFAVSKRRLIDYIASGKEFLLSKEDIAICQKIKVSEHEVLWLREEDIDPIALFAEGRDEELFNAIRTTEDWADDLNIIFPFDDGARIFGYDKMFAYVGTADISLHDALHDFKVVIGLYARSTISSSAFFGNILFQVMKDDAPYDAGTAYHHLNSIARTLPDDLTGALATLSSHGSVDRLREFAGMFASPSDIFKSWTSLKRFSEVVDLLERSEILDELQELRQAGKDKLYTYIETLAFHPTSKVNTAELIRFWKEPESFLANDDPHTPVNIHDRKKPSNYTSIPYLDLTAADLRDSLVEGGLDALQALPSFEVRYTLPTKEKDSSIELLNVRLNSALGSRREGRQGTAKNAKKLFSVVTSILKSAEVDLQEYLKGAITVPEDIQRRLEDVVYNLEFGIKKPLVPTDEYVARVNLKSSPDAVMAGNDTACCMPFGSGKNNVYTFNLNTALFTLQVVRPDGSCRTIAQSVLTEDIDVGKKVPDILSDLEEARGHVVAALPENLLYQGKRFLACDNVEINPNFSSQTKVIEQIYRDFFFEYLKRYGSALGLSNEFLPVGIGYSDALYDLDRIDNNFIPSAPVGYSDKLGEAVYKLPPAEMFKQEYKKMSAAEAKAEPRTTLGVQPLTFKDSLSTAYLEGKIYATNPSLITGLSNMENALIAKDINNKWKERPELSFKYVDAKGRMSGYMLAYEGVMAPEHDEEYDETGTAAQPVIYVADLAGDGRMAGGRLIENFVERYEALYLQEGKCVPIFLQARDQTSFRIIQRQFGKITERITKEKGIRFTLEEKGAYTSGEDTMHELLITPVFENEQK
jgi:hypothetical protein